MDSPQSPSTGIPSPMGTLSRLPPRNQDGNLPLRSPRANACHRAHIHNSSSKPVAHQSRKRPSTPTPSSFETSTAINLEATDIFLPNASISKMHLWNFRRKALDIRTHHLPSNPGLSLTSFKHVAFSIEMGHDDITMRYNENDAEIRKPRSGRAVVRSFGRVWY